MISFEDWYSGSKEEKTGSRLVDKVNELLKINTTRQLSTTISTSVDLEFPLELFPRTAEEAEELDDALQDAGWELALFYFSGDTFYISIVRRVENVENCGRVLHIENTKRFMVGETIPLPISAPAPLRIMPVIPYEKKPTSISVNKELKWAAMDKATQDHDYHGIRPVAISNMVSWLLWRYIGSPTEWPPNNKENL